MAETQGFKARVEYEVTDVTQLLYTFPFSYLRKKFIKVDVLHADNSITTLTYGVDYVVNDLSLTLTNPVKVGEHLIIYRQTTTDKIITWNDGSILLASDMNTEDVQMLHLQEEQQDYIQSHSINTKSDSDTKEVLWDALGNRITNVKDPKDSSDVVTKHYMESVQDGFVQQNTALANTTTEAAGIAKEAAGKAKDSSELAKKWAMSPVSPDGVADTNSPTGYTQSAKIWAALSKEYAGLSKFKLPLGYYTSVAEMKASDTAIVNRPCVTLGYYEPNDGGGAVYIIRSKKKSDVDNGGSVIFLDNGNVAELITDGTIYVEQWGAIGVYTNTGLQNIINYIALHGGSSDSSVHYKIVGSNVVLSSAWTLSMPNQWTTFDLTFNSLKGNFDDYLIKVKGVVNCSSITIGEVFNPNGSGISIVPANSTEWMQYTKIKAGIISVKSASGYYGIFVDGTNNFVNEIDISVNRFSGGWHGIHLVKTNGTVLHHCGFEYASAYIEDSSYITFLACRNVEQPTSGKALETIGTCDQLLIVGGCFLSVGTTNFVFSSKTYGKVITQSNDSSFYGVWRNGIEYIIWGGRIYNQQPGRYTNIGNNATYTTEDKKYLSPAKIFNCYYCKTLILDGNVYGHINGVNKVILHMCRESIGTVVKHKVGDITYTICTLDRNMISGTKSVQLEWVYNDMANFGASHWVVSIIDKYVDSVLDS